MSKSNTKKHTLDYLDERSFVGKIIKNVVKDLNNSIEFRFIDGSAITIEGIVVSSVRIPLKQ